MVKKYGDLYLECRRALMQTEDPQTAGLMARNLLAYYSGKTQEDLNGNTKKSVIPSGMKWSRGIYALR